MVDSVTRVESLNKEDKTRDRECGGGGGEMIVVGGRGREICYWMLNIGSLHLPCWFDSCTGITV